MSRDLPPRPPDYLAGFESVPAITHEEKLLAFGLEQDRRWELLSLLVRLGVSLYCVGDDFGPDARTGLKINIGKKYDLHGA